MHGINANSAGHFRKTRSGAAFSPWTDVGLPIHAPPDFELEKHLKDAFDRAEEESQEEDLPLATTTQVPIPLMDAGGSEAPGENPEDPADADCTALNSTQARTTNAGASASLTKERFHSNKRSKARRRKARALSNAAGEPGISKRPVKGVAAKRRSAAEALTASIALEAEVAHAIAEDRHSTSAAGATPIDTQYSMDMDQVPVTKGAFVGKQERVKDADQREVGVDELINKGFEYIAWDGRTPRPILDKDGRVIAVLAGRPRDQGWDDINRQLQDIFETTREAYQPQAKQVKHRRGEFTAAACGISYGGGQTHVRNLGQQSKHNQAVMDSLIQQSAVQRVANFGNSAFQLFAPRLYDYYDRTMQALLRRHEHLRPNFPRNVFANATFNLGPRTVSYAHVDFQNLPWGWCTITAAGDYDPTCSGHIVLWELKMVIEFPAGSTILIPSAIIRHSNTRIAPCERRYSLTQYSAGGLFRWVECGFKPMKSLSPQDARDMRDGGEERWRRGVEMLSMWSELQG